MAQKTPLPAKTVNYADRWNATWFCDLGDFKYKLAEDTHLRFVICCYLRLKRAWLLFMSINNSAGFFFFKISFLNHRGLPKLKPFVHPTKSNEKYYYELSNKTLKRGFLLAPQEPEQQMNLWFKKLSPTRQKTWAKFLTRFYVRGSDHMVFSLHNQILSPLVLEQRDQKLSLVPREQFALYLLRRSYNQESVLRCVSQPLYGQFNRYLHYPFWAKFIYNIKDMQDYYLSFTDNLNIIGSFRNSYRLFHK